MPALQVSTLPSVSAQMPYCSAAQLLTVFDWRTIAQLCSDNDVSATQAQLLDPTTKPGGILDYALRAASGNLETAVLKGGIYSVSDLQNATGQPTPLDIANSTNSNIANINTAGAWYIRQLVASYAKWLLYSHRPDLYAQIPADVQQAAQALQMIASGQAILPLQPNIDAGHLFVETETTAIVDQRHLTTLTMDRYFGRRNNRRGTI